MESKRLTRSVVGVALSCLTIVGLAPSATAAPEFELRGTVLDRDGAPLASVCVTTEAGSAPTGSTLTGSAVTGSAVTDRDGTYVIPIDAGSHTVRFTDCAPTPTHVTQWWSGRTSPNDAEPVTITDGDLTLGPVTMQTGVSVSGTVRDRSGAGQPDTHVTVSSTDGRLASSASSGPDGTYRTGPLPDGTYTVRFDGPAALGQPVQYWKSSWTRSTAAELTLRAASGSEHTQIDASMVDGSSLEGVVTDEAGAALGGLCVGAYQRTNGSAGDGIGSATTRPDGSYTLTNLPPVETLVQFSGCTNSGYVSEWYDDAARAEDSRVTHLEPGQHLSGVDARMMRGASISGQVTDSGGTPLDRICVNVISEHDVGDDGTATAGTTTDAAGKYHLGGLGPEPVVVGFHDCNDTGPYISQWFDGADDPADATTITLVAGEDRTGVDARLGRAGTVSGRVTDRSGPLGEVCVQASDDRGIASSARTEDDGRYRLDVARSGAFVIQFVDCSDDPGHVGVWWGGGTARSSAVPVRVEVGEHVDDVSVELALGAPGTVRGRVTNVRGEPLAGLCVVVYLPHDTVRVATTGIDGTYAVPAIGSGTWAVAYLACGKDDLGLEVADPAVPAIAYRAQWLGGEPLLLPDHDDGPDPIAQGAVMVEVPSGGTVDADACFGCGLVSAEIESVAGDVATFSFAAPDLLDGADVRPAATATPIDYEVACAAEGRPTLHSATVDRTDSPVGVVGLVAGADYRCEVSASVGGVTVASSAAMAVVVPAVSPLPPRADSLDAPNGRADADTADRTPNRLAFTGSTMSAVLLVSFALLVAGILVGSLARSRLVRLARSSQHS